MENQITNPDMIPSFRLCHCLVILTLAGLSSLAFATDLKKSTANRESSKQSFVLKPSAPSLFRKTANRREKLTRLESTRRKQRWGRTLLEEGADDSHKADSIRSRIARIQLQLEHKLRERGGLLRERDYMKKTNELIKGKKEAQDGVAKLSHEELEEKAREIEQFRSEIQKITAVYNSLATKQQKMEQSLMRMRNDAANLEKARDEILVKISHLNIEDFIIAHSKGLPLSMAGAIKKSAEILVPFFDTLSLAADTNHRLVEHVSSEIDKYTHVNVGKSPFMSGIVFYCVVLIPILTLVCFIRRIFDASIKLGVTHFVIFGNLYFLGICVLCIILAIAKGVDPLLLFQKRHEKGFIIFNLFLGIYYIWHVGILCLQTLMNWKSANLSQLIATGCVGVHFFIFTWRRVFLNSYPTMFTHSYLVYATIFAFITYERCMRLNPHMFSNSKWILWLQGKEEFPTIILWHSIKVSMLRFIGNLINQKKSTRQRSENRLKTKQSTRPTSSNISDIQYIPSLRNDIEFDLKARQNRRFRRLRRRKEMVEKAQQRYGFLQAFFGAPDNGNAENLSSEDEDNYLSSTWNGLFPIQTSQYSVRRKRDSSTARKAARNSVRWWT